MVKGVIVLCIALAVQAIAAYEEAVPVMKQPRGSNGSLRIFGGQTAQRGQIPYQAAVLLDGTGLCGGTLINKRWVLTAGHCVLNYRKWIIYLGCHNIREVKEEGRITLESQKGTEHEMYNPKGVQYDVAVIELPEDVQLNKYVNIAHLPPRSYQHETLVGKTVRASGWGLTSEDFDSISPELKYADLTVITNEECRNTFGSMINRRKYCVKGLNKESTCGGDSGGPVTIGSGENATSIGIVSFGSARGCTVGLPVGLTAVPHYVDWISRETGIPVYDF